MSAAAHPTPPATTRRARRARRRGISLFEALIALVLLSLAALAYARVQLRAIGGSAETMWRSQAALLAYDMGDRMRANRAGWSAGGYDALSGAITAPTCGDSTSCSTAQTARLDFARWRAALAAALPSGGGAVCLDSTPDDGTDAAPACDGSGTTHVVKIFWREHGEARRLALAMRP